MSKAKTTGKAKGAKSAADLLGKLNSKTGSSKAKPKRDDRQTFSLDEYHQNVLARFAVAYYLEADASTVKENAKSELEEYMMDRLAEHIWEHKDRFKNPKLEIRGENGVDVNAIYVFQDKYKIAIPIEDGQDSEETAVRIFTRIGLSRENAEALVENELDMTPITALRPFNELVEGHYGENRSWVDASDVEKEAGRKLLSFVMADEEDAEDLEPLTDEEREIVLTKKNRIVVRSGFFSRVASYCEEKEDVLKILGVLKPVCYPKSPKFGVSDTPSRRLERLVEGAAEILGVDPSEVTSNR